MKQVCRYFKDLINLGDVAKRPCDFLIWMYEDYLNLNFLM